MEASRAVQQTTEDRPRAESSNEGISGGDGGQQAFAASTAPLTFTDFLEKMRAPAAMDLVRSIKNFISDMLHSSSNADRDSTRVQDFLARSENAFRSHPLWAGSSYEEFEAAGEGLEKYLMTKLYGRCFAATDDDKERDALLSQRMKALSNFIKPEHLDIPEAYRNESSWILAQKELQKINTYKAPRDKLVCILNCCRVISNLLSMAAKENSAAGADDFLPVLIYVLIRACPSNLESNLAFIMRYRLASRLSGEAAYFYTNMVSASSFIETITANSLSIDPSEFIAHMQAAGVPGSEDLDPSKVAGNGSEAPADAPAADTTVAPAAQTPETPAPSVATATPVTADSAPQLHSLPSLRDLEAQGSESLLQAESLGELHARYRFLYSSVQDVKVKDVASLLEDYKELALRYESVRRGYRQVAQRRDDADGAASSWAAPALVRSFHRVSSKRGIENGEQMPGAEGSGQQNGSGQDNLPEVPPLADLTLGGATSSTPAENTARTLLPTPPTHQQGAAQGAALPDLLS